MFHPVRYRPTALLSLLLGALLLGPAGAAAQSAFPPTEPANRWGINDDHMATGLLPDTEGRLPEGDVLLRARAAGIGWARYLLFWHAVNPAPGEFRWLVPDVEITRLRAAGFNVLVQIAFPPTWTTGATYGNEFAAFYCLDETRPDQLRDDDFNCRDAERRPGFRAKDRPQLVDRSQDFREFVDVVVRRYGSLVQAWGFGVEVHNKVFWKGDVRQLMDEVLRPGYEVVKAVDPRLLVVGPDEDVESFFDAVMRMEADDIAAGKGRVFDVLAFHAFWHSGWIEPGQMDTGWRPGEWGQCSFTPPHKGSCSMKDIATRYAMGRPVWVTEFGYRAASAADPGAAAWLATWIDGIKARPWIDKAFLYRLQQDADGRGFGLFAEAPAATPSPARLAVEQRLAAQPLPQFSYLAEGATNGFFDLDVLVANPNPAPAPVKLTLLNEDGTVETLADTLPATSRRTYGIGRTHLPSLATAAGVSTVVESTQGAPLVVERSMFWNQAQYYGGHGGTAVSRPETRWYFGEGAQGFFDTYVLLANSGAAEARVTVTFLLDEPGADPVVVERRVAANTRDTVWAGDPGYPALAGKSFSIAVESDQPIIAERAMYFGASPFWTGGHESAGVPALSTTWLLAEGATGPFFDNYVLVGNPGEADAEVTFTFLLPGGRVVVGTPRRAEGATGPGVIAARSRFTLDVENAAVSLDILEGDATWLADTAVSTKVVASAPIVVERAMYWPGSFATWTEAHNSFGVTETGTRWGLGEGRNGGPLGFETYILVANPSADAATITVTFLKPDGTTTMLHKTVEASSRFNVWPWEMPTGEFGAVVDSTNGVPIVVERAMYWTPPGGPTWGGGTNATAVRLR